MDLRIKIAILNIIEGVSSGQIDKSIANTFFQNLKSDLDTSRPTDMQYITLLDTLFVTTKSHKHLNLRGKIEIGQSFISIKSASDLQNLFTKIDSKFEAQLSFDEATSIARLKNPTEFGRPLDEDCIIGAGLLNQFGSAANLILGLPHKILWITPEDDFLSELSRMDSNTFANLVRDKLGLVHIGVEHLFAFVFDKKASTFATRPTAFNGADNSRFCQSEALHDSTQSTWGVTTWMKGEDVFAGGKLELIVNSGVPISGYCNCVYVGETQTSPPGTDSGYSEYLLGDRRFNDVLSSIGWS